MEVIIKNGEISLKLHAVYQDKQSFQLKLKTNENKEKALGLVEAYSKIISDENILMERWKGYRAMRNQAYLNYWSPVTFMKNRYLKAVFRKTNLNFQNKRS